jgi:hypothetical protein
LVTVHRVVADPRPGLSALAELVDDPADLDELIALRNLSDPFARAAATAIALVPVRDRYSGSHAAVVMAPFLWLGASRFSPGTFGVLYAARSRETAVRESAYHAARMLTASHAPAANLPRVALEMKLDEHGIADYRRSTGIDPKVYDPYDYAVSQRYGADARAAGNSGLEYDSVRHVGGLCFAVFRPASIVGVFDRADHLELAWDGAGIASYGLVTTHYL